jgi:hypothetical protein
VDRLKKNHPKNGLGYTLAVAKTDAPDDLFEEHVIRSVGDARHDATVLGLIRDDGGDPELTRRGREAVRTVGSHHGGILPALRAIGEQTGRSARFITELPVMGTVVRHALLQSDPTRLLVATLDRLAGRGRRRPSLVTVATALAEADPNVAVELFVTNDRRGDVLLDTPDGTRIQEAAFEEAAVYATNTTFQYKATLYHVGLLTERGVDTKSELDPRTDVWALDRPMPT